MTVAWALEWAGQAVGTTLRAVPVPTGHVCVSESRTYFEDMCRRRREPEWREQGPGAGVEHNGLSVLFASRIPGVTPLAAEFDPFRVAQKEANAVFGSCWV